jgi:hypothetical protein
MSVILDPGLDPGEREARAVSGTQRKKCRRHNIETTKVWRLRRLFVLDPRTAPAAPSPFEDDE